MLPTGPSELAPTLGVPSATKLGLLEAPKALGEIA
jgi:hypothetical protein